MHTTHIGVEWWEKRFLWLSRDYYCCFFCLVSIQIVLAVVICKACMILIFDTMPNKVEWKFDNVEMCAEISTASFFLQNEGWASMRACVCTPGLDQNLRRPLMVNIWDCLGILSLTASNKWKEIGSKISFFNSSKKSCFVATLPFFFHMGHCIGLSRQEVLILVIIARIKCRWQFVHFGRISNFKWFPLLSLSRSL